MIDALLPSGATRSLSGGRSVTVGDAEATAPLINLNAGFPFGPARLDEEWLLTLDVVG